MFAEVLRNPSCNFNALPFPDTRITHYYDADPTVGAAYAEAFPGVKVARKLEEMVENAVGEVERGSRAIKTDPFIAAGGAQMLRQHTAYTDGQIDRAVLADCLVGHEPGEFVGERVDTTGEHGRRFG